MDLAALSSVPWSIRTGRVIWGDSFYRISSALTIAASVYVACVS